MTSTTRERARVLVLVKGLGLGGAETLIVEAGKHWDRASFEYRVAYFLPWKDQLVARLEDQGIRVDCLGWGGPQSAVGVARLRRLIRSWCPQVIHAHLPVTGILGRLLSSGAINVYTEHNIVDSYRAPTRMLNRWTYRRNDAVIAVSQAVADSVAGYPGPTPFVVPNGVVVDRPPDAAIARVRDELGIDGSTPLLVHVGNIRPHKGHDNLIEAVAILVRERPDAVVVSIGGGKHHGDLERVRARSADLGLSAQLRFLGRRPDALDFVAAADVVVNPSDVEGLPLSVLEALALGRPVVATSVGGVPSVIRHGETGLLVDAADPDQLAKAMIMALDSPEAPTWGAAGAELVAGEHGLAAMVGAYESIYSRLLA
ncbi:MAG: glycosyltransferase [Acidimicrobiia bacterium]